MIAPACLAAIAAMPSARADPTAPERWPIAPAGHRLSLDLTERLTQLGNLLGEHLDLLSADMIQLRFDGRRRRARVRLGGGTTDGLQIQFAGDIKFDMANARIQSSIDLALHGHLLHLELPDFEMSATEYRGEYGVQIRLPIFVLAF